MNDECAAIALPDPSFLSVLLIRAKRMFSREPESNLIRHAEEEMRRAGLYEDDADYGGMIPEAVMKLVRALASDGHSGGSHALVMEIFNRVANFKTLTPLTNATSEWTDVSEYGPRPLVPLWQNKRQSSCFSEDGGLTYKDMDDPEGKTHTAKDERTI